MCVCVYVCVCVCVCVCARALPGEKDSREIKDAASCFAEILKVKPYKTAAVQPLTSDLSSHPS